MAEAIIKVSWRRSATGAVLNDAVGGIAGSCFTLSSGITISCAHHMGLLFQPNAGYHACRVWIAEASGRVTEIRQQQVRLFPEFDAAIVDGFQSSTMYEVSKARANDIKACDLIGYRANEVPFSVRLTESLQSVEIFDARISTASQRAIGKTPIFKYFTITSLDINVANKVGYLIDSSATVGLSGGPMLDSSDQTAVGVCFLGIPQDSQEKTQVGVLDLRHFPFI